MTYEKPTKKNIRQITICQHYHTAHAISYFYDVDKKVEIKIINSGDLVKRHSRSKIFCSKRTWDERAEKGYMIKIENAFHEEIDNVKSFNKRNHEAISKYCLLWRLRHQHHLNPQKNAVLKGVFGYKLTKEKEEILEQKKAVFIREDGTIPSRFVSGNQIQISLDRDWEICRNFKWGLLESKDGEFIVADGYGDFPFIPISPKFAYWVGVHDQIINQEQLAGINKESINRAKEYYFARKISVCPVL